MRSFFTAFLLFLLSAPVFAQQEDLKAVQLYSQDELLRLINRNEHLTKVVLDDCQLVQDIEARAQTLKIPAYQFLWGDMLAWGVCVESEPSRGIGFMQDAAMQGLPEAMEQLGRYYANGKLVQQDISRGIIFLREAGSLGNLKAQIQLAELFIDGHGSPYDYEDTYHWLYNAITDDNEVHRKISDCMSGLEALMHPKVVRRARRPLDS
ncbi:MAG: tetratricopeptide repeat protein [Aestuariibacter sp.]